MLRNFHRSVSSLLTIRSSLLTRPKDSRVLYFWNSPVKLNSSDNKDDRDGGTYLDYKGKIPLVNTKVDLRFHVLSAEWIPEDVRHKILEKETNRINKNGELFLSSMKYRSQQKNLEDAIEKVEMIIKEASYIPKETTLEKKARVKKLARIANEKRLLAKRYRSERKRDRWQV
ncbi:peptidyl-tRNA hydrolase ICT1, mitochondrial-like isoform X2 [Pocillopora damicornis]|uniref:peptidyl-tRNA hydrolase ICT1, mitochondrial-like isoform X2 n=1 Tax=Pocillopora damicornis TaxID=46731 RepID=UPI000F553A38|nr:peptidyl-tRNA hydrolase ICT1, mitochondrial-like isoform X2 [Pocillopora damicornis]